MPSTDPQDSPKTTARITEIYFDYRTSLMNCMYYEKRAKSLQRQTRWIEIFIAATASLNVASLWLWKSPLGSLVWSCITCLVAIASIIHAYARFPQEIERLVAQRTGYNTLYRELEEIVIHIKTNQQVTDTMWRRYLGLRKQFRSLYEKDDLDVPAKALRPLQQKVNQQIPSESLWWPDI